MGDRKRTDKETDEKGESDGDSCLDLHYTEFLEELIPTSEARSQPPVCRTVTSLPEPTSTYTRVS